MFFTANNSGTTSSLEISNAVSSLFNISSTKNILLASTGTTYCDLSLSSSAGTVSHNLVNSSTPV